MYIHIVNIIYAYLVNILVDFKLFEFGMFELFIPSLYRHSLYIQTLPFLDIPGRVLCMKCMGQEQ